MEPLLFAAQRLSALLMVPFIGVHLGLIIYASRGGLTTAEILGRTQGHWGWMAFYGLFVLSVSVHAPIGLRNVLVEWAGVPRRAAGWLCLVLALVLLAMGLRAVASVGGLRA